MKKLLPKLAHYNLPMVIEGLDSSGGLFYSKTEYSVIQHIFNGGKLE